MLAAWVLVVFASGSGHAQHTDHSHGHAGHDPAAPPTAAQPRPSIPALKPPAESKRTGAQPAPSDAVRKAKHKNAIAHTKQPKRPAASEQHSPQNIIPDAMDMPPPAIVHHAPDHSQHHGHAAASHTVLRGSLGPYAMTREGSGTSWLPDATPHGGVHLEVGGWTTMWHALLNGVYDSQGGPRGGSKAFVNGMVMGMAQRQVGDSTFGLRAMLSPDAFMGRSGYPLLLATGETADGRTHLIDRQHPHEMFMELAATYSYRFSQSGSLFLYAGLPGEPALGPTPFMHRTSGIPNPEAPITHHWLDSTHITFGVVTAGVVLDRLKLETSAFRGREPDKNRYDIESPKLDSFSARATWNPFDVLSMQVSWGRLQSPEALMPGVNEDRVTASVTFTQAFAEDGVWSTTWAWGRKTRSPDNTLDGYLFETAVTLRAATLFLRAEQVENDELRERGQIVLPNEPPGVPDTVNKISFGGVYDFYRTGPLKFGVGALTSRFLLPADLAIDYGKPRSYMAFMRMKVQ